MDEISVLFGEDVAFGGVFRCSLGLQDKYGIVLDTFLWEFLYKFTLLGTIKCGLQNLG